MAGLISLRPHHTEAAPVNHPVLDKVAAVPEEELNRMAFEIAAGGSGEDLILALRAPLRNLIGRYLYYWPASRPFADSMVSEGLVAFSALIPDISLDFLAGRDILNIALRRAQDAINTFLNSNQSLSAPSLRQQKKRQAKGQEPLYVRSEIEVTEDEFVAHPEQAGDEQIRDVLDALDKIERKDEIDEYLLDHFNWGRGLQELADELGVGVGTVHRRRTRLYQKYLEITR